MISTGRYGVSGPTAATAVAADNAIAMLWNPSSSKRLFVKEVHLAKTVAGAADIPRLRRATVEGTTTTSFTPGIEHDYSHGLAPESGAKLDLAWSAQPTFAGTASRGLVGFVTPGAIGAGVMWVFEEGIQVKAGNGLCIVTGSALAYPVSEATFIWRE